MDCFLDFCLACDKQTTDGLYCSQACRLTDLEKAGTSAITTPLTPTSCPFEQTSWPAFQFGLSSGFSMPPALHFNPPKNVEEVSTDSRSKRSSNTISASQSSQSRPVSIQSQYSQRELSPSSSRSSLSSAASKSDAQISDAISEQARHELRDYFSSFDQTREMKRRSLSSNASH